MADPGTADELRFLPSGGTKKSKAPNVSGGWIVMVLSGLIAVVIFLYATQQGAQKFSVAVVGGEIAEGQPLSVASLTSTQVNMPENQLNKLVTFADRNKFEGWIVSAPLQPGDLLSQSSLRPPSASDGKRAMSVPVASSRAVAGDLHAGDRVDVVDTSNNFPGGLAAKDLQVISVNSGGGRGGLGSVSEFSITVSLTAEESVNMSKAILGGKFDVVRSTGATPIATLTNTAPSSGAGGTSPRAGQ